MTYYNFLPTVKREEKVDRAREFLDLILNAEWQRRKDPVVHPLLMLAAQIKADDMARNDYYAHTSPTGISANANVRAAGYVLPNWYPNDKNNVESISRGLKKLEDVVQGLHDSPKHYPHVSGDDPFYANHRAVGAGLAIMRNGWTVKVFVSAPYTG